MARAIEASAIPWMEDPGRAGCHQRHGVRRTVAKLIGVVLLLLILVFVLGSSKAQWGDRDACTPHPADAEALFGYMRFYECSELLPKVVKAVLLFVWLMLLISLLATTADSFFVPQLDALSHDLHLPEDVAGVTLLALGNGMPDVMTATSAITKAADTGLVMGEFFGAANFILSFVLGCVFLCQTGPTSVDPWPLFRDAVGYVTVVALMLFVSWDNTVGLAESLSFFAVYAVYVAVVVVPGRLTRQSGPVQTAELSLPQVEHVSFASGNSSLFPHTQLSVERGHRHIEEDILECMDMSELETLLDWMQFVMEWPFTIARHLTVPAASWNKRRRVLAAFCVVCTPQLALLSFGTWDAFCLSLSILSIELPVWLLFLVLGTVCATGILASRADTRPKWHGALLLFAFAAAVTWFNLLANECVAVLETFGINLGISSSILGITVLAWGNSVGDLAADTALAKQGKAKMAIAGCFGSPLLSDLIGLGLALTSYTLTKGPLTVELSLHNKCAVVFLLLSVSSTILGFVVYRFTCPRRFAFVLILEYAIFMVVSVALELGRVHHHKSTG